MDKFGDLGTRIISAIVMVAIALLAFWLGGYWVAGLLTLLACVMMWEYAGLLSARTPRILGVMLLTVVAAMLLSTLFGWKIAVLFLIMGALALYNPNRALWGWSAAGLLYIGGACMALLAIHQGASGSYNVFWLVLVVILSDIGGYFAGRIFGGPKLWPAISPKKTWSGTLGGWVLAALAGTALGVFGQYTIVFSIIVCMILTIAAQAGDLLESWIKRRHNVKDASDIIPGHGGLLDRFDGMLAASLVFSVIPGIW